MPNINLNRSTEIMLAIAAMAVVVMVYKADSRLRESVTTQKETNYQIRALRHELEAQNPDHPRGGLGEPEDDVEVADEDEDPHLDAVEDGVGEELGPEEAGKVRLQAMDPEEETVESALADVDVDAGKLVDDINEVDPDLDGLTGPDEDESEDEDDFVSAEDLAGN